MSAYSTDAIPPVREDEARTAQTAICVFHRGLISQTGDTVGRVFYCPVGKQYWRYSKRRNPMYARLPYPKVKVI